MNNQPQAVRRSAFRFAWVLALAVLAINIYWAVRATSPIALVDGWAVLNRIMHFDHGDIDWKLYLFRPHGAHLHSVVYALSWLDFKYADGVQTLTQCVSLAATALYGMFFVRLIVREGARQRASNLLVILGCGAAVAAISSLADLELMLHPFQVVLSVSRLTYVVLLYAIIVGMIEETMGVYVLAMLVSLIAVTFHGTGYIFAICVIVAHVLVCRRPWMAVASLLPLLSAFIIQRIYSQGSGELSHLGEALKLRSLVGMIPAMSAFFASPLAILSQQIGNTALLCVGFLIFCAVTALTVRAIFAILGVRTWNKSTLWQQVRAARTGPRADPSQVFLTVIGVFLLASGVAATLFWVIRTAADAQQLAPYYYVLNSGRYGAFACLGFAIVIVAMLRSPRLRPEAPASLLKQGAILVAACLFGMALYASRLELRLFDQDDRLNTAAAGILAGLKPTEPGADFVWEGALGDPYWAAELPITSEFMRSEHKGLWKGMPAMGTSGGVFYAGYPMSGLDIKPVASAVGGRCSIRGTVPKTDEFGKAGRILPLANAEGQVVGYGALLRDTPSPDIRVVSGFARCPAGPVGAQPFFLAHDTRSIPLPVNDQVQRGSGMLPILPLSDMKGALRCALEPGVADKGPTAVLTLANDSNFAWTMDTGRYPIRVGVHLVDSKGDIVAWDNGMRVPGGGEIAPHASATLRTPVEAIKLPAAAPGQGPLTARFGLVQDGRAWFPNLTCDLVVRP